MAVTRRMKRIGVPTVSHDLPVVGEEVNEAGHAGRAGEDRILQLLAERKISGAERKWSEMNLYVLLSRSTVRS